MNSIIFTDFDNITVACQRIVINEILAGSTLPGGYPEPVELSERNEKSTRVHEFVPWHLAATLWVAP
jgi:hypothetical protein